MIIILRNHISFQQKNKTTNTNR